MFGKVRFCGSYRYPGNIVGGQACGGVSAEQVITDNPVATAAVDNFPGGVQFSEVVIGRPFVEEELGGVIDVAGGKHPGVLAVSDSRIMAFVQRYFRPGRGCEISQQQQPGFFVSAALGDGTRVFRGNLQQAGREVTGLKSSRQAGIRRRGSGGMAQVEFEQFQRLGNLEEVQRRVFRRDFQ